MFDSLKDKINAGRQFLLEKGRHISTLSGRQIVIILVAILLAFLLWLVVNLNRTYTVDIKVPLNLGQVSANRALAEELPDYITASISGEGWNLLTVYRNPPHVFIEVSGEEVNLFEQVRRQLQTSSALSVQKVDPLYLRLHLEKKASKKVPVIARVETKFASQYNFLTPPDIQPDSITVSGAASIVSDIHFWLTDSLKIKNIDESFSTEVPLKDAGPLITLSAQKVDFIAQVAQFTEGKVTVPVELRNAGAARNVIFSPQEVEITYLAPIEKFPSLKEKNIFSAYVTYQKLLQDTTGFVSPQIEQPADSLYLKVQQVQPSQVAYFNIVSDK